MSCTLCGVRTSEPDSKCTFCRARDRFWVVLDELPFELRGWAISNLRIWAGIVQEEHEKFTSPLKQQEVVDNTAAPKSAGPSLVSKSPTEGRELNLNDKASDSRKEGPQTSPKGGEEAVEGPDKSWIEPKREKDRNRSPRGSPGVEELDLPEGEGKYSSGSKAPKEEEEKSKRKRSKSDKRRERSRSKRSGRRRRRSSSRRPRSPKVEREKGRSSHQAGQDKEKKAKPSVRPPRTPSRSPPGNRGGPPPKQPPVARRGGPPPPEQRPTGRQWSSGPFQAWQRQPQFWGTNKGRKKKEEQYYFRR